MLDEDEETGAQVLIPPRTVETRIREIESRPLPPGCDRATLNLMIIAMRLVNSKDPPVASPQTAAVLFAGGAAAEQCGFFDIAAVLRNLAPKLSGLPAGTL